jgi:Tetratricopeptide repeat
VGRKAARAALAEVEGPYEVARAQAFLGRAHVRAGRYERGTADLRDALGTFERTGSVHWQARTLEMLGEGAGEHGDPDAARGFFRRAVERYAAISPGDAQRLGERLDGTSGPPG